MNPTTLFYGDNLIGKTSLLALFLEWLRRRTPDLTARLVTAEDWSTIAPLQAEGLIEVWDVNLRDHPFETLKAATRGFWPADPEDPTSKLLPPSGRPYLHLFEGLATFSDYLMGPYAEGGLANLAGKGIRVGPGTRPGEDALSFKDGDTAVGGNAQTHYNLVQRWVHGLVVKSKGLHGHVAWTSHETRAVEDGIPIIGPEVVGNKATPKVPRWFGRTLHLHMTPKGERRIYTKQHYDEQFKTVPYKATTRLIAALDKEVPEFIPYGEKEFFKLLDQLEELGKRDSKFTVNTTPLREGAK